MGWRKVTTNVIAHMYLSFSTLSFKILIAQCKFYKRNCIETEQIQNKDGVTQINQKWGSLKCPYHWITPRHFTQCIWNMYLQVHIISYRYHYRKPTLRKFSYTLTKPYPLHIDMQFIRNICLKIKSDLFFLLTISKLCNLNPYTAPLLALFM